MPAIAMLSLSLFAGVVAALLTHRYPRRTPVAGTPTLEAADEIGRGSRRNALGSLLRRRRDPTQATEVALVAALAMVFAGGVGLAILAYLVRSDAGLLDVDNSVAQWGADHASPWSTDLLESVTHLGDTVVVVGLAVVLAAVELWRAPSRWVVPFLLVVVAGQNLLTNGLKEVMDRLRPAINPIAEPLGPSFPSGHSATAAAFYAAAALLLGRRHSGWLRAVLAGTAVGLAVAVASTRVLIGVHWLTDVIGGLMLGWMWFAVAAIAFGGRLLRFGAATAHATAAARGDERSGADEVDVEAEAGGAGLAAAAVAELKPGDAGLLHDRRDEVEAGRQGAVD